MPEVSPASRLFRFDVRPPRRAEAAAHVEGVSVPSTQHKSLRPDRLSVTVQLKFNFAADGTVYT